MFSLNRVMLAGNVTKDPEEQKLKGGQVKAKFTLAVNRQWKSQGGEVQKETIFVDCVAWGKTAENVLEYVRKGRGLFVEGRLCIDHFKSTKDGSNVTYPYVTASSVLFGPRPAGQTSNGADDEEPTDDGEDAADDGNAFE